MAHPGVRMLSLDGGGTRGLVALSVLRELMNRVIPEGGGNCRPSQYFDLIAGTGLAGLCALLFSRFNYTVDEAIEFSQDLSKKLDDVVDLRKKIVHRTLEEDLEDWIECIQEYNDPKEQIEGLRQGIVQDCWSAMIQKNVVDGLERYIHMVNEKFDYKRVDGQIEVGRSKAFVVASESKGYDTSGGVSESRQYHVPILHRTYECRHGKSTYTLYAIGLGTVASPGVMKPGVTFPNFLATGSHSAHNPVHLILDESRKLWPGIRVSALISIGTGSFDIERSILNPLVQDTGKACQKIADKNKEVARDIERHVLPFDKGIASAYFRFDNEKVNTFFESTQVHRIAEEARQWMGAPKQATKCSILSKIMGSSRYPDSPEDLIALSSLASLAHALGVSGYAFESIRISDIITNYILYESCSGADGSFRKLRIAAAAEGLSGTVLARYRAYAESSTLPNDLRSESAFLNDFIAFGHQANGGDRNPGQLQTIFDCVSATYYCLVTVGEKNHSEINSPRFSNYFKQLCAHIRLPSIDNPKFFGSLEDALQVSTISGLCQAAATQLLHGVKGLAYNGDFIRQIKPSVVTLPLGGASNMIVDPIANLLALLLEVRCWSSIFDTIVIALLNGRAKEGCQWSLTNLALRRCEAANPDLSPSLDESKALATCSEFLYSQAAAWRSKSHSMIIPCVQNGWFSLIRKSLWSQELTSTDVMERSSDFNQQTDIAFKFAAQAGHPYMMKRMVECVGIDYWKRMINQGNAEGLTAIHLACQHRAPKEIFRLLQICGGDVNARCHAGRTPLSYCFPDQALLPSVYQNVLDLISAHQLPTTASLEKPKVWDGNRNCNSIDPRAYDFRVIVNHLLGRNANISISDNEGMTPLHRAAKKGWGDVLEVFFMHHHGDLDTWQKQCLTIRDNNDRTVLDYARMAGERGDIQGREDTIIAEMGKLQILVSPKGHMAIAQLSDVWRTMPVDRPRLPTPEPTSHPVYPAPSSTPVLPQQPTFFPAPYVYHDPAPPADSNLQMPTPSSRLLPSEVYRNPAFATSATPSANTAPARQMAEQPRFPQPYVYSDPVTSSAISTNSSWGSDSRANTLVSKGSETTATSRRSRLLQKFVGKK
ncbi:hypothetical protein P154DRAFT_614874 [Amniculicola lignicola CBS 123094]|uniref:phospholipase A2 n=1 Tax=Amniculicola lignicola CBS 123094 TaxID=1392246 RepID=A0A6A5X3S1_9PLEO|nr:hypothetical protein P154DRAFT_614874 [Amniculicola lignicola CBS 123094]